MKHQYLPPNQPNPADTRNVILAVALCVGLLFIWQMTYVRPKQEEWNAQQAMKAAELAAPASTADDVVLRDGATATGVVPEASADKELPRAEALLVTPRVKINAPALHGSINLKGLRFDDLTLVRHRTGDAKDSPEVILLSPSQTKDRYFAQIGWLAGSGGAGASLPDGSSVWQASHDELTPERPVTLTWVSPEGVTYSVTVAVDANYMFSITQRVDNASAQALKLMPYGLLNRSRPATDHFASIVHEGPIATIDNQLTELNYADLEEQREHRYPAAKGWLGISDKYWLTAFITGKDAPVDMHVQAMSPMGNHRVQVDYLAPALQVASGGTASSQVQFFAGAKELGVLESYEEELEIPIFDRAVDFGVLFFLTYPIFVVLSLFYGLIGNFGVAIMILVVVIRLVLYPIANKSYKSMAQMRAMTPELERIRKMYDHDKLRMQQETMALWKREKINPLSGCLPILIQIPVFFALYKTLLVTIEMRHAPFFGWISDLSAPDPTNIFTLFGLIPWDAPSLLHLGAWPIIMTATMVLQQKLSPKPTDPTQAKVLGLMPYLFLFLFATFPAGLVIYWAWNNLLSILQQWMITREVEKASSGKKKAEFLATD